MGNEVIQGNNPILPDYTEVRKEHGGTVVADKQSDQTFLLQEWNYPEQLKYNAQLAKYQQLKQQHNESLLNVVEVYNKQINTFCSTSFKIYVLYEYPNITLHDQIKARKKEQKYFQEHQLWAILQSCANAILEIKPTLSLHPCYVFVGVDGILKIINDDMVREDHREILNTQIYYAPEKVKNFHKTQTQNNIRKQGIFSLGMTMLHSALLQPVHDCYDYANFKFNEETLQTHLKSVQERYSEQFFQVLSMILEVNPNKRSSLMEIKGMVTQVWNTEENSKEENDEIPSEDEIPEQTSHKFQSEKVLSKSRNPLYEVSNQNFFTDPFLLPKPKEDLFTDPKLLRPKQNLFTDPSLLSQSKPALFTDPKLLEMIRQDLHNLNQLKQSTMRCQSFIEALPKDLSFESKSVHSPFKPSDYSHFKSNSKYSNSLSIRESVDYEFKEFNMMKKKNHGVFAIENYDNGSRFEGMLVNGIKEGPGKLLYSDGAYYEGQFKNDFMHGKGVLHYGFNKPAYDGHWHEDQFNGYGVLYNQTPISTSTPFNYRDFNLIDNNWLRYEGSFEMDYRSGHGKLILTSGQMFEGQFADDCLNGHGKFTTRNGEVVEGIWQDNLLIKLIN